MWTLNLLRDITGMDDKEKTECAILSLTRLLKLGVRYVDAVADEPIENGTDCYWAKQTIREKKDGELYGKIPNARVHATGAKSTRSSRKIKRFSSGSRPRSISCRLMNEPTSSNHFRKSSQRPSSIRACFWITEPAARGWPTLSSRSTVGIITIFLA